MADCSCKGANPNCFKCGGLGAASLGEPSRARSQSYTELVSSLNAMAREPVRRRTAPKQFRNLQREIRGTASQQDATPANATCTCPLCGTLVKVKNLPRHNRKAHSGVRTVGNTLGKLRQATGAITSRKIKRRTASSGTLKATRGPNKKRHGGTWFVQGGLCNGR